MVGWIDAEVSLMCAVWASICLDVTKRSISLASRGPDGEGWVELETAAARHLNALLAISGGGDCLQPVGCSGRNAWLAYNGEIYNHAALWRTLASLGHSRQGRQGEADTWPLFAALQTWGKNALKNLEGMFAFAFFDRARGRLTAARDPFGIKPLYMLRHGRGIAFASEIKQFLAVEGFRPTVNMQRAADFLELGITDHARETMWLDVTSVPPGGCIEVQIEEMARFQSVAWYRVHVPKQPRTSTVKQSQILEICFEAVRSHSDVNVRLGASLPGGLWPAPPWCAWRGTCGVASIKYGDVYADG
jgi:asparagine synthase (glutamine-hydrolysing)